MSYIVKATEKTPEVIVDKESGKISLIGVSIPDNPYEFYSPMIEVIDQYMEVPRDLTEFSIRLEYFNTSTALVIRNLLKKLEPLSRSASLEIKWFYEGSDEDMMEAGEEFKILFKNLNFELLGYN